MPDMDIRPYTHADLPVMLDFVGRCNAAYPVGDTAHPGDIAHHLSNALRGADPGPYLLVATRGSEVVGLIQFYPHKGEIEMLMHPALRGGDDERALLRVAVAARDRLMQSLGKTAPAVIDLFSGDVYRGALLAEFGFVPDPAPRMAVTMRDLAAPNPAPALPDGFSIRSAAGVHEAGLLAAVHSAAFGSNWTPEKYRLVMETPGFVIDHERVVVAPDGTFAAFLVYWLDSISKIGLFEPVGCAEAYQRRGLVKALMYDTLELMRTAGMTRACVKHELDNPASTAAYASVGFVRVADYTTWTLPA
ncbi:MAG: GNAT family N-acetyltransferase [Chloroflexi bacterium]|nr:GNAT family N-acetyltransferase [Chloroflexota bacterium]